MGTKKSIKVAWKYNKHKIIRSVKLMRCRWISFEDTELPVYLFINKFYKQYKTRDIYYYLKSTAFLVLLNEANIAKLFSNPFSINQNSFYRSIVISSTIQGNTYIHILIVTALRHRFNDAYLINICPMWELNLRPPVQQSRTLTHRPTG